MSIRFRVALVAIAIILFAGNLVWAEGPALFRTGRGAEKSPVEVGVLLGRDGAAFGPGVFVQGNLGFLALYGFAGQSSVSGYETENGIRADFSDRTLGFGVACRVLQIGRFTFGVFAQAAYYGSRVTASYPDGYGGSVEYRESDRDPLVAVGPEIDYQAASRISVFLRAGKDFGPNFAATTAGGFSIDGGVSIGGMTIVKGIKKLLP